MTFDPFLADKVDLLSNLDWSMLNDPEFQRRFSAYQSDPEDWEPPAVTAENREIPGPHGLIPVRIYRPPEATRRLVVWLHGGGFSGGDLDMAESHVVSMELAHRTSAIVVSVAYRLAGPNVRYPVPIDDAHEAWLWARKEFRADDAAVLGGASAGAAIALSVALREKRRESAPTIIILAYPFVHFPVPALHDTVFAEMVALPRLLRFSTLDIEGMVEGYVGRLSALPSDALPGAADLDGLPPTLVVVDEYDDLRPSAELIVRQLRERSVAVDEYMARGMPHGHLNRTPGLPEVDRTLDVMAGFIGRQRIADDD